LILRLVATGMFKLQNIDDGLHTRQDFRLQVEVMQ